MVHNGIIENWIDLKDKLVQGGHVFESDTDTEVVAHMIEDMSEIPLADAVRQVMNQADGALALVVMRRSEPDLLVGARRGSPLGGRARRWGELPRLRHPRLLWSTPGRWS